MNLATDVPLLAGLSNVELAKLLKDMDIRRYQPGETIVPAGAPADSLYFIIQGTVEVSEPQDSQLVPLLLLATGATFGEAGLGDESIEGRTVTAISSTKICRVPLQRFKRLMAAEPAVAEEFLRLLASRLDGSMHELTRVKRMLAAYVNEVWSTTPPPPDEAVAATAIAVRPPAVPADSQRDREADKPQGRPWWRDRPAVQSVGLFVGTALSLSVYRFLDGTLASASAILVWAACNWLIGAIPDYVIALVASVLAVLLGVASPSVAFSGFANPGWFLLLGVLGIGVAVSRSGLVYRLALHMLRLLPPTYRGQSLALALTGVFFTPLLPSSNSRAAIGSPLARELSEAMRFPPQGNGSAGLAMSGFLGFGQMYFLFFNGGNICMLAWSLMPDAVRQQVTWLSWVWLALPLGLLTFAGSYGAILFLFPPEPGASVSRDTINAQLKVLGQMTRTERVTSWVLGFVLVGFLTQPLHQIDPAWVALAGFLWLVTLGIVDRQALKELDWSFLLLIGSVVSLADITKLTGLSDHLTAWIGPIIHPLATYPYLFIGAVALLMLIARLAIPLQPAVLMLVVALLPVSIQIGYNPFVIVIVALAMSNSWLLPQQNTMYLTVYSATEEKCFTHRQVRPLGLLHALIGFLAVLASVPFWHWLGLVP